MTGKTPRFPQTVLVVDGEEVIQQTIGSMLKQLGYCVLNAADIPQANEVFIHHAWDLALLVVEISLPTGSGLEFVNRLPPQPRRVPVLFLTAMGRWEANTVRNLFPVLEKPFRAGAFNAIIKTLVPAVARIPSAEGLRF